MIKTLLLLPPSLPWREKALLWTATTLLLSTAGFAATFLGIPPPAIIGAMAIAIVPLVAGLAKVLRTWTISTRRSGVVIAKSVGA